MLRVTVIVFLVALSSAAGSYEDHEVWKAFISNNEQKTLMGKLSSAGFIDCWSTIKRSGTQPTLMSLKKTKASFVKTLFDRFQISHAVVNDNLQRMIESSISRKMASTSTNRFDLNVYHSLEEVYKFTSHLAKKHEFISKRQIGVSTQEGTPIELVTFKVSDEEKPSVYLDCGIHAREWITVAVCNKLMHELAEGWSHKRPQETEILNKFDVHIVPVYNPEGYNYTWNTDRMWRKNRRHTKGKLCRGVDLNRNYDVQFCEIGASSNPCSETYCGAHGNSELETQAAINTLSETKPLAYFNIHSYSQLWMYPYGYTDEPPRNEEELKRVANIGVDKLTSLYNTSYEIGPKYFVVYPSSGSTIDYIYDNFPFVKYAFTLELRDRGEYGFLLPEEQIPETTEETYQGIMAALRAMDTSDYI